MTKPHRGFTLTEILIVVSIIVIIGLALLVGLNPLAQIFKGYDTRRKSDLSKIKIALENYYSDHDCYPNFPRDGNGLPTYTCDSDFLNPYLKIIPCDPNTGLPYTIHLLPEGTSCPQQYAVYAHINSFFDRNANIPFCPDTISVNSPDITEISLSEGCSGREFCPQLYGCVGGACVQVADGNFSDCKRSWCEPDCGDNDCSQNTNRCH